ncbi:MAG: hypothetical protein ACRDCN_03595 [Tannerellaceae bacterium]
MKKIFIALLLMIAVGNVSAQTSKWSAGANLGPSMGASIKYNFSNNSAFEGIAAYNIQHNGPMFTFLYEYHVGLVDCLRMYMGGGMNMGALHVNKKHGSDADFAIGISPVIGLEYNFKQAPITFGFDYKPAINFTTCNLWNDVAFKLRFRF